jgi:hypothetical protein
MKFKEKEVVKMLTVLETDRIGYDILLSRDLIEHTGEYEFTIKPIGKKVLKLGGWGNYLKYLEEKDIKGSEKYDFDYNISRLQSKNGLFPYIVSGLSLVISILTFSKSCTSEQTWKSQNIENEIITIINKKLDSFQKMNENHLLLETPNSLTTPIKTKLDSLKTKN